MKYPKCIAVANAKGGTGKSSVATGIAKMLSNTMKVALLDLDITSANDEFLLKLRHKPADFDKSKKGWKILPRKVNENLEFLSIKSIQAGGSRGTEMSGAYQVNFLKMALEDAKWSKDNKLFILDMPAGTDDMFSALSTLLKRSLIGIVLVTQPRTLLDTKQIIELCSVHAFPILGVVENMVGSKTKCCGVTAVCSGCGAWFQPFGEPNASNLCDRVGIPYLGAIPLTNGDVHKIAEPILFNICSAIQEVL